MPIGIPKSGKRIYKRAVSTCRICENDFIHHRVGTRPGDNYYCPTCKKDDIIGRTISRAYTSRGLGKARYRIKMKKEGKALFCEFKGGCTNDIQMTCELDINHKDGNRENNAEWNLEQLCANHHRRVTVENKHSTNRYNELTEEKEKVVTPFSCLFDET